MLFGKPKAPFRDYVLSVSVEQVGRWFDKQPRTQTTVGAGIALLTLNAAESLVDPGKELAKDIKIHPDVLAFEGVAFAAYAIRFAYEPQPGEDDDEDEFAEANFDEYMNDAFKLSYAMIVKFADDKGGWDTLDILNRRLLRYMAKRGIKEATEEFIGILETTDGAAAPMAKYPGPPSLDLKQHLALLPCVMAFVGSVPPAYARTLRGIMTEFEWTEPGLNGAVFGERDPDLGDED